MFIKVKRGQKLCPNCKTINGVRSFGCKNCLYSFKHKKVMSKFSWKHLQKGDKIKVFGNSGPFYKKANGERVFMCNRGKFSVINVDKNGIHAKGIGLKSTGYCYIYMGRDKKSSVLPSITLSKHKVVREY